MDNGDVGQIIGCRNAFLREASLLMDPELLSHANDMS